VAERAHAARSRCEVAGLRPISPPHVPRSNHLHQHSRVLLEKSRHLPRLSSFKTTDLSRVPTKDSPRGDACGLDRVSARPGRCRVEQGEVRSALRSKDLGLRSCDVKWAGVIGFRQARDRSGVSLSARLPSDGALARQRGYPVSPGGDRLISPSPATPARHRRILADDIHWFIFTG
jgi:hypothetical protein